MIIVPVRHQHDIDRRQIRKGDTWIVDPFGPHKAERRYALRPYRVEQNIEARSLDQQAGMADIGNAQGGAFDACRGTIGVWRRCPNWPLRFGGTPPTIYVPTQQIAPASRRCAPWVEKNVCRRNDRSWGHCNSAT